MKLHPHRPSALNTVTGYGDGYVEINAQRYQSAIVLMPERPVEAWPVEGFDGLSAGNFAALLAMQPEIVLLGTGPRQRFPHPRLTGALAAARIGLEAMDTGAACRTYNILMSEGRQVLAALLLS